MDFQTSRIHRQRACAAIESGDFDFTAKFYAANDLYNIARHNTRTIDTRCIEALKGLLLSTAFDGQRQRRFLFREAANVLSTLVQIGCRQPIAEMAYDALRQILYVGRDHAHQAAAEALGRLPLDICGPEMTTSISTESSVIRWQQLLTQQPFVQALPFVVNGRSLTARLPNNDMAVIKMARRVEDAPALRQEIQWLKHIASMPLPGGHRFDVPRVVEVKGAALFRIKGLPSELKPSGTMDSETIAVGFVSSDGYYCYPNDGRGGSVPHAEEFIEMMGRNAYLFGWLSGLGIVHQAPIPLFHNRVQQQRRRDGGVYEWYRAGRLDRWLASSAYPNFGRSGLRDFEHFTSFRGQEIELYRHMGNHLLSLLLVAGSYFRAKDARRIGWGPNGKPIDARYLFDRDLLQSAVRAIYQHYYLGFVGIPPQTSPPFNIDRTVDRMIDEMGVDRHMEEYLRVADQQQMTQGAFETFLTDRGYDDAHVSAITKGTQDLVILSGPHLGAFNRGISLPELIEAAAAMAAVCVAERFIRLNADIVKSSRGRFLLSYDT